jgi:hypothetical protein
MTMQIDAYETQQEVAASVHAAIDLRVTGSNRSSQSKSNILGVSDIGNCHEYVRRMILDEEPSQQVDTYNLAAFIGHAIGDHAEDAMIEAYPYDGWVKQDEVVVSMRVRGIDVNIPGHPDLYNRKNLIDFKTKNGLGVVRRRGPSDQERFQRSLYAKALIEAGKMDRDAWVHNVYIDRSGAETEPVVWSEPFDYAVVAEAIEWLDDVMYAVQMGEEAYRDPSREWCWAACPFAPKCRGFDDSDVEGKITDPEVVEAIKVYEEAKEQIKALEKDKKSAESVLAGVEGATDTHKLRWITVQETLVPETMRAGYMRLDLRPLRVPPKRKERKRE